jgi:uncharacterized membrane protein
MFLTGIACIISRIIKKLVRSHRLLGKLYILCLLWTTATSLLIHNTGLPDGVLYSFLIVLMSVSIGWISIDNFAVGRGSERNSVRSIRKTQKVIHGTCMIVSWINISGRIFSSPLGNFVCHTYPFDKNFTSNEMVMVPQEDPNTGNLPWNRIGIAVWCASLSIVPSVIIGIVLCFGIRIHKNNPH